MAANVTETTDVNALSFGEHAELLENLQKTALENPQDAVFLLPQFYRLTEGKGESLDMLPLTSEVFATISQSLSKEQINQVIDKLYRLNKSRLIERGANTICMKNPACCMAIFDRLVMQISSLPYNPEEKNFYVPAVRNLTGIILCAPDNELPVMMNKIAALAPEIQKNFYKSYGKIYSAKPTLRDFLWHKIINQQISQPDDLQQLYNNLGAVAGVDESKLGECLRLIGQHIKDPNQSATELAAAYHALGIIRDCSPNTSQVDNIFLQGLQHTKNSMASRKIAYRCMGKFEELLSRSTVGQRSAKTADNPFGFSNVTEIDITEPAILFLGGSATSSNKNANGYLSSLEELLRVHHIDENIGLYAAVYDFGDIDDRKITFNDNLARTKLMQDYHRKVKISKPLNEDTLHPKYIDNLFELALLPRICDKSGQRFSVDQACQNIRKLTIIAHCHGAYTFLKLEERMQQKMAELGYSAAERKKIQHELLCIAHAPYAPLGVAKSTMISFACAGDWEVSHYNNFEKEIRTMFRNNEVLLSYFAGRRGELFLTPSMGEDIDDHNFCGYNLQQKGLSKEGKALLALAGNAIINGIRNSQSGGPLPTVREIVCGQDENIKKFFDQLQKNGEEMWQKITKNTLLRLNENGR